MTRRRDLWLCCLMSAFSSGACRNAPPLEQGFSGTWVLTLSNRPFYVLNVTPQGGSFTGTLTSPEHWTSNDRGTRFSGITATTETQTFTRVSQKDAALQIVIVNPADKADQDEYELRLIDADHATLTIVGLPFPPWPLTRSRTATPPVVATDWDPRLSYNLESHDLPNAEMAAIFDEDQKARQTELSDAQWAVVAKDDAVRRTRTAGLLTTGALKAGEDFRKAAFVFQHGDRSDDYLMAHTLALVALARGEVEARWIAAASLDRYLHSIGKPEIYGAGFTVTNGKVERNQPFNDALISDALRTDLGVPPLAEQLKQMEAALKTGASQASEGR